MKNYIYIITLCSLFFVACSKDFIDELGGVSASDDQGTLKLTYSLATTKSDTDELLAKSKLKIYRADGELIRYYKPATEAPDELYLVAGSYSAELSIDYDSYATTSFDECGYYGKSSFTITANQNSNVSLTSTLMNSAVQVLYDATVAENFEDGYITYVTGSNSFDMQTAQSDKTYTLSFTESGTGYFILPDDVSNISWGFSGTKVDVDSGEKTPLSISGVISNAQAATLYTLTLKYSESAGGMIGSIAVSVDEETEDHDDNYAFSPQPTVSATGFSMSVTQVYTSGDSYSFAVSAVNDLQSVDVEVLDNDSNVIATYSPYVSGQEVDLSTQNVGVSYSMTDSKFGSLTLSSEFFEAYSAGGVKSVNIVAKDVLSAKGEATPRFAIDGVVDNPTCDLWLNSGVLQACATSSSASASNVKIAYRKSGATDWIETSTTLVDDYTYQAEIEPQWTQTTSDGGDAVYYLASGFTAGNTYEYKYSIDGVDQGETYSFATSGVQTITDSGLESSSLSCWGSSNGSSTGWASGNNSMAGSLCTQGTYSGMGGSACAYLAGSSVILVELAAGNLFLGQFSQSGTTGTASFGQGYTWTSRPTSFKFKYAASLGTVDASYHKEYISEGSTDQARIFFAIVDWSGRHAVVAGTSSPSGVWNPATSSSVTEGQIIGYASLWITSSTSGSTMHEEELTVYYYDKQTKPSKSISIVISCATSAYGDYMNGSTSSKLYVDDFEFGY